MAISSFYGLQTSLRGLLAQQRALDTTGHNIANANTQGYSRQEAIMVASPALEVPAGAVEGGAGAHLGSGVDVQTYKRIRDTFLDLQYRVQNKQLGYGSTRAEQLDRAELALAEPSENGIATQLEEFWDAWSDVANSPSDTASRTALVEQAAALAQAFKTVDAQLATVGQQAKAEFTALTEARGEVDVIADELASLNGIIKNFRTAGDLPNDLMDQRDLLLDRLSELGALSVQPIRDADGNDTGSLTVYFGNAARPIVTDTVSDWPQDLPNPEGKLGALRSMFDPGQTVDTYRDNLDAVARRLADTVNALHTSGGGPAFFTFSAGAEAGSLGIAVNAAGVQTSTSSAPGANDLALKIAELREKKTTPPGADELYRAYVAGVGTDVREARVQESNAQTLTDAVEDRRQSVAGVSLDEEMSNMIRFQRGYQASSRAMSTMDEMLDVLINRTGRVGL